MRFPSKSNRIQESILYKMTFIMERLQNGPIDVKTLYTELKARFVDTSEYLEVLDCLYILRKISVDRIKLRSAPDNLNVK